MAQDAPNMDNAFPSAYLESDVVPPKTSGTNYTQSSIPLTTGTDGSRSQMSTASVRTLPPWVRSVAISEDDPDSSTRLLPTEINEALIAQHNHSPYETSQKHYNKQISSEDDIDMTSSELRESRWKKFLQSANYPGDIGIEEKRVSFNWLNDNMGDYSEPWGGSRDRKDAELGRQSTWTPRQQARLERYKKYMLRSPMIPLILRLTVWIFSVCALALGGSIRHLTNYFGRDIGPSANMAIIVDAAAFVYLVYITYDEYASKPLGLRSPKAKIRLMMLDIVFIVFDSANLSLAFASLSDAQGTCTAAPIDDEQDGRNDALCDRQTALASVLLVALIAWLFTFSISIFRLVERVSK